MKNNSKLLFYTLLVLLIITASCSKPVEKYSTAFSGLNVRQEADKNSKVLGLIPYGQKVTVVKTKSSMLKIGKQKGHWAKIKWQKINGWVFDAFLEQDKSKVLILDKDFKKTHGRIIPNKPYRLSEQCDTVLIRSSFGKSLHFSNNKVELNFSNSEPAGQSTVTSHGKYNIYNGYIAINFYTKEENGEYNGREISKKEKVDINMVCTFAKCGSDKILYCSNEGIFIIPAADQ